MVRTMTIVVPLALVGTFPIPTFVMTQIDGSNTIYTNNSVSFPISKAYVNRNMAYFIATDASDNHTAASIAENLGYEVNYAPTLTLVPKSAQQQGAPNLNFVNWKDNATARELRSAEDILIAQSNGELEIARTNILINSPAIQHR